MVLCRYVYIYIYRMVDRTLQWFCVDKKCIYIYIYRMVDRTLQWFCVDLCICIEWWTGLYSGFV